MTESAPDELVLDEVLPRAIAEAEAALRRPNRGRAGLDLLRPAVTSLAAFDTKRNPGAVHRLAMLLTRLGLHAEAGRLLDWAAWRTTRGSDAWLATENVRAILAAARGERDRAALLLDLALRTTDRLSVTSAKLHANLAVLCLETGESGRAARHATAALTAAISTERPAEWPADLLASAEASAMQAIERSATDPPRTAEELRDLAETQFALAMRRRRLDLVESAIEVMELAGQHLTARLPATHPEAVRLREKLATAEDRYADLRAASPATPLPVAARPVAVTPGWPPAPPPDPAREGVPEAYHLVVDRYLDSVFRFVYYRVGDRRLADELTSTAVRRVLHRIDTFTGPDRELGAWLIGTARQVLADHPPDDRPLPPVDDPDHPARDSGAELVNGPLLTAVRRLDAEQRDCLVLRFLQALSVAETARAMGQTESRVRAVQHRAVRALTRLLPPGPPPPWPDVTRRRVHRVRYLLRKLLRPSPPDLFRGDGEDSGSAAGRGVVHGADRLIVLGLQLRAIPTTRSSGAVAPCPQHPIACPPPLNPLQPEQSGAYAPTPTWGHGGPLGKVDQGSLLTPDSDARLRSMLLAIVGGAAVTMAGADGAAPGTPGGAVRSGSRIVVTGRAGQNAKGRRGRGWRRGRARGRDAVVASLGVVTIAVSALAAGDGSTRPARPVYALDRSGAPVQPEPAASAPNQGRLLLGIARSRLDEASAHRDSGEDLGALLDGVDDDIRQGSRLLTTSAVRRRDPAALDSVDAFLDGQHRQVAELLVRATPTERDRVAESVRLLDAVRCRVDRLRTTLSCDDGAPEGVDTLGPLPADCATR
ncbi:sigma-70 family RNA polymerase sigma factor [Plantactinospora sp. ZYX-F-223]|uniref:sigma-70 family RNA polymerase sigma factor n=1 Tax=Plantactinospora sp. ZYX-F-223 TaxID=3144103 RepID=UPI0031FC4AF3